MKNINIGPIGLIGPISNYKTHERVSTDATSNTACASRQAKTYPPGASSPTIFYKPRATSSYRQKYHPACHPAQPRAHALPGASNASPKSDPGAPETSCSDEHSHLSTKCASYPDLQTHKARFLSHASSPTLFRRGPTAPSPSTAFALHQSASSGPCDGCTQRCPVEFPPSPTPPRRNNQSQFPHAGNRRCARRASLHGWDESRADSYARSHRAASHSRCACESALQAETSKSGPPDLLRDCLCERDS